VLIRTVRKFWQVMGKPEKKIMIGRWNGYHGSTLAATALGGMKFMHEMGGTFLMWRTLMSRTGSPTKAI
jgi:putrescine aminotransferase